MESIIFTLCGNIEENMLCCMIFKFWNLNGFLNFCFLNSNISITILDRDLLFETLWLSFHFMF